MKKYYFIQVLTLFSLLLSCPLVHAQFRSIEWSAYLTDKDLKLVDSELVEQVIVLKEGNQDFIYVTGQTYSTSAEQTSCNNALGNGDCFLAKYTTAGKMKWIRYFGGHGNTKIASHENYDWAYCLAADKAPNGDARIYVGGTVLQNSTAISCIPGGCNEGVYQALPKDAWDAFIAKYDGDGNLLRCTYLGGGDGTKTAIDEVLSIEVHNHMVYVGGYTESPQNSLLNKSKLITYYDTTYNGGGDGFIAVFDTCLSSLQFFSYYNAGSNLQNVANDPVGQDRIHDVKVGPNGDLYISGSAESATGISFNSTSTYGGMADAFVSRWLMQPNGSLIPGWSAYIGGKQKERGRQVTLDDLGNIYTNGTTRSTKATLPSKGNVIQKDLGGDTDVYVAKLDENGNLKWFTYLGSSFQDIVNGLQYVKSTGGNPAYVAVTGLTQNCDFFSSKNYVSPILNILNGDIVTPCTPTNPNVKLDVFVALLTDPESDPSDTMHLTFGSFFGGSKSETAGPSTAFTGYGPTLDFSSNGTLYLAFSGTSEDVGDLIHGNAASIKGKFHGATDATLLKLSPGPLFDKKVDNEEIEETGDQQMVLVYPQPFEHNLTLQFGQAISESFIIKILNSDGRLLKTLQMSPVNKYGTQSIDLSELKEGMYIMQIISENENEVLKIIRQ